MPTFGNHARTRMSVRIKRQGHGHEQAAMMGAAREGLPFTTQCMVQLSVRVSVSASVLIV